MKIPSQIEVNSLDLINSISKNLKIIDDLENDIDVYKKILKQILSISPVINDNEVLLPLKKINKICEDNFKLLSKI